jgi:hypothetical protein
LTKYTPAIDQERLEFQGLAHSPLCRCEVPDRKIHELCESDIEARVSTGRGDDATESVGSFFLTPEPGKAESFGNGCVERSGCQGEGLLERFESLFGRSRGGLDEGKNDELVGIAGSQGNSGLSDHQGFVENSAFSQRFGKPGGRSQIRRVAQQSGPKALFGGLQIQSREVLLRELNEIVNFDDVLRVGPLLA